MSWHCLQEPEEEFSVDAYLAGLRSERSRLNTTRAKSSCSDSGTDSCRTSPSGTTSALLMGDLGGGLSMSLAGDSLVKTSQPQERGRASRAAARGSGRRCTESFARFDRGTCLWRTPQLSLLAGLDVFSETWPRAGMMRRGWCWELPTWELRTGETGFGFSQRKPNGETSRQKVRHMMPTPTACNAPNSGSNTTGPKSLLEVARTGWNPGEFWPTPCSSGKGGSNAAKKWKKLLPTPLANDAKNNGGPGQQARKSPQLGAVAGGALNPPWVEWLMGWPIGWTDSSPLEMGRFRLWLQLHSVSLNEFLKER